MAIAVNDVIQVTYFATLFNQVLMTVLHYRVTTAPATATPEHVVLGSAADNFANVAIEPLSSMKACTSEAVTWTKVRLQKVKPTRSIYAEEIVGTDGDVAQTVDTANVCASITKRSAKAGRQGVGHVQWPPLAQGQMVSGSLEPAFQAGVLNDFASALTDVLTVGIAPYEMNLQPCLPGGGADTAFDIWDCVPQSTVRTMHRRTVGLGI